MAGRSGRTFPPDTVTARLILTFMRPSFGTLGTVQNPRPASPADAKWILVKVDEEGEETPLTSPGVDRGRLEELAVFLRSFFLSGQKTTRYIVRHR